MILDAKMADAVIATNDLISKSLAMVSEDSSVNRVLEDLFNAGGNEVSQIPLHSVSGDCLLHVFFRKLSCNL